MNNSFVNTLVMKSLKRYFKASKKEKGRIIDNIVLNTSFNRKSVIRKLKRFKKRSLRKRGGSKPKYLPETNEILKLVWRSRDFICAELLHPYLPESIKYLSKYRKLESFLEKSIIQVEKMPLGTLKLKLKVLDIERPNFSYYRRTGEQLKKLVPVNTAMNETKCVGNLELDFVDHNGGDAGGLFCRTLCCVDILTQYVIRRATRGKAEKWVRKVFSKVISLIIFQIKEMHTDNERSLLKSLILQKSRRETLHISRSRSYQKQDNGHVEQKNGDKIRLLVGYKRYDTDEETKLLNQVYYYDDLLQNHFIPSRKLVEKVYDEMGKLVRKKWDEPKTPYERIMENKEVGKEVKKELELLHSKLNPLELKEKRDKYLRSLRNFQ